MRFSTTPERRRILNGFLGYRAALHKISVVEGFQWLDGSFLEDVENLERRSPRDIDVVTFFRTPTNFTPSDVDMGIFEHDSAKLQFHVDSYSVELDELPPELIVENSTYWYSMWSHRRNQAWKGFLQVDLAPSEDKQVKKWLDQFDLKGSFS